MPWAAVLSAEVMAEHWRYSSCSAIWPHTGLGINERGSERWAHTAEPHTWMICHHTGGKEERKGRKERGKKIKGETGKRERGKNNS